ncbi:DUF2911 domain-containing protein [Marinoscillum sp. MHG1-6]|uniref:DUF2911 domain-containing protein n=1 Tax=Marinoscillum sp. MHG1-6 TaxID=2959627 RepID=UPI002157D749|nr:DUF2911 domain-containing protein [Marinoscillum sp. MHG1-6]
MKVFLQSKMVLLLIFMSGTVVISNAQTVTTPRPSPKATLTQRIGLIDVSIQYSRPSVIRGNNDRTGQIWGVQVPYGLASNSFGNQEPMPWRAGANENTIFSTTGPIQVEGQALAAGSYGLHMIPQENGTVTLIFSSNTSSWGSFWYEKSEDVMRLDVQMEDAPFTNVLTYEFTDLTNSSGTLALIWENKQIPIQIACEQETILQSFRDELRGVAGFGWRGKLSAAQYCFQNNMNHEEAIEWVNASIADTKNAQNLSVKAGLLFQNGQKEEGIKVADEAAEMANLQQLNFLGYQMLGAGEVDRAIGYFKLNIKNNPTDANAHDSLGEAYMAKGENKKAIKEFQKCLSMNPPKFVRDNSIKNLKTLGVDYES